MLGNADGIFGEKRFTAEFSAERLSAGQNYFGSKVIVIFSVSEEFESIEEVSCTRTSSLLARRETVQILLQLQLATSKYIVLFFFPVSSQNQSLW